MCISVKLKAPVPRMVEPTKRDGCMIVARELMPAVQVLSSSSTIPPRAAAMIAAHTLECALKAFLWHKEIDASSNSDNWHNLLSLWHTAYDQHLSIPEAPPDWVTILSSAHDRPYYLRYQVAERTKERTTIANGGQTPALIPMVVALKQIIETVEFAIKD